MKLQNYLKEVVERQNGALLRNQALFKELDQLEARMKTSGSAMIQKMEVAFYKTYYVSVYCCYGVAKLVLSEHIKTSGASERSS